MSSHTFPSPPTPFLELRVHELIPQTGLSGLCAGYEAGVWRGPELAAHLMHWLPEFALTHTELHHFGPGNALELIVRAANNIYTTENGGNRGEFGELLLHLALRQCFSTLPAISKYYYKDASNDTVKGFDAVHVVATETSLELWLGEVKFYDRLSRAIRDAVAELALHLERDYLRAEFATITNKIDPNWPHAERLQKLLHPNTSLDQVFDAICVPVLLTYESPTIAKYTALSEEYRASFEAEVRRGHAQFCAKIAASDTRKALRIHLFLVPLLQKKALVECFDAALKRVQGV